MIKYLASRVAHWTYIKFNYGARCHYPVEGCFTCEEWLEYDQTWKRDYDKMVLPSIDAYDSEAADTRLSTPVSDDTLI